MPHNRVLTVLVPAGVGVLSAGTAAFSQGLDVDAWDLRASVSTEISSTTNSGDAAAATYDTGTDSHVTATVTGRRDYAVDRYLEFDLGVSASDSQFYGDDTGVELESFRLVLNDGTAETPFHLEFGDVFGYFSERSLQRGLTGLQVEFQPNVDIDAEVSAVATLGFDAAIDALDSDDPLYFGGSVLVTPTDDTQVIFNAVGVSAQDGAFGQQAVTAGVGHHFERAGHRLSFEGELGMVFGDHGAATATPTDQGTAFGAFAEVLGETGAGALNYGLTAEVYDEGYAPSGSTVVADSTSVSAFLRANGQDDTRYTLRTTFEQDDAFGAGANTLDRLAISGSYDTALTGLGLADWSGGASLNWSDQANGDGTVDENSLSLDLSAHGPVGEAMRGNLGYRATSVSDSVGDNRLSQSLRGTLSSPFSLGGADGRYSLGVTLTRDEVGATITNGFAPHARFGLASGAHSFDFVANGLRQSGNSDAQSTTLRAEYGYRSTGRQLRVYAESFDNDPANAGRGQTQRVGLAYSMELGNQARRTTPRTEASADAGARASGASAAPVTAPTTPFDLSVLPAGLPKPVADSLLARLGYAAQFGSDRRTAYAAAWLPATAADQKLVVEYGGGAVRKAGYSAVMETSNVRALTRIYDQAIQSFSRRYGPSDAQSEIGEIAETLAADLAAGTVTRFQEWQREDGTLRVGFAPFLDGEVHVQAVFARTLPSVAGLPWGVEPGP